MNFINHLTENNIKPSVQRLKVYEYLYNNKTHPTVDNIYINLVKEIPTLSKTTVYNTLKLFVDSGIVTAITIEDNEVRYDAFMDDHAHFKCDSCGRVYDVEVDLSQLKIVKSNGFRIDKTNIYLNGKCKKCLINKIN